ncbi:MAG TPA: hypothetical protein VKP67_03775 [Xanthobacteraceae bacterium]|nr:hypothetical protein [Xanthobacteraceae bacterium]
MTVEYAAVAVGAVLMELKANSRVDALKIDLDNGPAETNGGDVVRLMKTAPTTPAQ